MDDKGRMIDIWPERVRKIYTDWRVIDVMLRISTAPHDTQLPVRWINVVVMNIIGYKTTTKIANDSTRTNIPSVNALNSYVVALYLFVLEVGDQIIDRVYGNRISFLNFCESDCGHGYLDLYSVRRSQFRT